MAVIGNSATQQAFTPAVDYFSGNASTTAFTLSRPVASVAQVEAVIDNVVQNPSSAYTVSGNTITFTSAPLSGTNNIYVRYTSPITQVIAPGQGTVNTTALGNITNIASGNSSLTLQTGSGNTTAVTIDTSQNVGIGTTSPTQKLDLGSGFVKVGQGVGGGGGVWFPYSSDASGRTWRVRTDIVGYGDFGFEQSTTQTGTTFATKMLLDQSGNLLVGRTSTVTNPASSGAIVYASSGYSTTDGTTTANYTKDRIYFNATNYYVLNGSSTGVVLPSGNTSWSAQSDERTKDIIEPIQNATQKLSDFRCVIGKYKTDDSNKRRVFLIAQDVQKVLPEAVTELDDENKTLALSYTDVIPLLVASIKELKALVDAQATEIAELKAKVGV